MTNSFNHKPLIFNYIILIILSICSQDLYSQIFDDSQTPPSQKWIKLEGADFRILIPKDMEVHAPTLVRSTVQSLNYTSHNFGKLPRKITFIVHNTQLEPNGFVQLAPRKSELYSTAPSTADNQAWLPNLVLHESRHVSQFDKLTGKLRAPFLEQLALAYYGLTLPSWYFEGDAVLSETIYSHGGRGRLPEFEMPVRANYEQNKYYTLDKYILGSYKDIVPSYYTIGYLMTATLKQNTPVNFESELYNSINKTPLFPYNFYRKIRRYQHEYNANLFDKTFENLSSIWRVRMQDYKTISYTPIIAKNDKFYVNYRLPKQQMDTLFFIKESPEKTPAIYIADTTSSLPRILVKTGAQITPHFDVKGSIIIWDELRNDRRYGKQSFNVINSYNRVTGKTKTLTRQSRYYTPVFNPVKDEIACVEVDRKGISAITLLNPATGDLIKRFPMEIGVHLQQPAYHQQGEKLVAIQMSEQGTSLCEIDLTTGKRQTITPWGNEQFERPQYFSGIEVLVKSNLNGIDNIYRINIETGERVLLTKSKFGAFNPFYSKSENTLLFNDYRYNGYQIAKIQLDSVFPVNLKTDYFSHYYQEALARDSIDLNSTPDSNQLRYTIEPYKGLGRTINFHSITLSGNDFESFDNFKPGIFWLSNNLLNTTQFTLGYEYDNDLRKGIYSAELAYRKYFPKFSIRYENRAQIGAAKVTNRPDSSINFDWREHYISSQISLPLSYYRRDYIYSTGINVATAYLKRYDVSLPNIQNFNFETAFPFTYQIYFNRNSRMAKMDITPRWGQNFSLTYRHLPFENQQHGEIISGRTNFYLPGFATNHAFQVRLSAQSGSGIYQYTNDIPLVSGFSYFRYEKVRNTLLINYRFPITYPDLAIGPVVYIKRLKGGVFSDFQNIHRSENHVPKSFGLALSADFNAFRYPLPDFEFAIKATYINDNTTTQRVVPTCSLNYTY